MKCMVQIAMVYRRISWYSSPLVSTKGIGYLLRSAKADRNEMYGSDSDGVNGELASIHRLWFQQWQGKVFFAIS